MPGGKGIVTTYTVASLHYENFYSQLRRIAEAVRATAVKRRTVGRWNEGVGH